MADDVGFAAVRRPPVDDRLRVLCERLLDDVDDVVAEALAGTVPASPELAAVVVRAFLDGNGSVEASPVATALDDRIRALGSVRHDEGMELAELLGLAAAAGRRIWEAVLDRVHPGEEWAALRLGARWMVLVESLVDQLSVGWVEAASRTWGRVDTADAQARLDELLRADDGRAAARIARRHGLPDAPSHRPVVVGGPTASRPLVLVEAAPPGSLVGEVGGDALVVVPHGPGLPPSADWVRALDTTSLVAVGRPVEAGPALREQVEAVRRVAEAARLRGAHGGCWRIDDLLPAQLLVAAPAVADRVVAEVADGLEQQPASQDLWDTLVAYLETGSATAAAERTGNHLNTVTNRLRRVHEITGLDPRVPVEATLLHLAAEARGAMVR